MAKSEVGLPAGFSINVSKEDLEGPARLPDYLDSDPLLESLRKKPKPAPVAAVQPSESREELLRREQEARAEERRSLMLQTAARMLDPVSKYGSEGVDLSESNTKIAHLSDLEDTRSRAESDRKKRVYHYRKQAPVQRRLQINLTPDSERKVQELLDLINQQSPTRIMITELVQALLMSLYDARGEINVSRLPSRGKWGTVSVKNFASALSQNLREAVVNFQNSQGENPFKKVVGK